MTDKNNDDNKNVFSIVNGSKEDKDDGLPQFDYIVEDLDGDVDEVHGFPVFSPQYIMIMRELEGGVTIPVYMKPIHLVKTFTIDEDDDEIELPF